MVRLKPVPAVAAPGALTLSDAADAEPTAILLLVPVTEPEVAISLTLSALSSEIVTVAVPLTSATEEGATCCPSLAERLMVPLALFPYGSLPETVTLKPVPAVAALGALTVRDASPAEP